MPTLLEQLNELAMLMEDAGSQELEFEKKVSELIAGYEALGDKLDSTTMISTGPGSQTAEGYHLRKQVWGEFEEWVKKNYRIYLTNTPRGGKPVKEAWKRFVYDANAGVGMSGIKSARMGWEKFRPMLSQMVKLFGNKGEGTREVQTQHALYVNAKGMSAASFKKYVQALDALLGSLKGWRRKALGNGLRVVLAGKDAFRGTAAGRYNVPSDTLFVKATPAVLKRTGGSYGAPDYILIHELGHRYEKQQHVGPKFDTQQWFTTRYSSTDSMAGSESFAELFALGHFGITGVHGGSFADTVQRFEKEMG